MSSEPTTPTGRALVAKTLPGMKDTILAIEAEMTDVCVARLDDADFGPTVKRYGDQRVAAYRADLEAKVRALPSERVEGDGAIGHIEDFDLIPPMIEVVGRAAVLRLLTDGAEPPKGGSE